MTARFVSAISDFLTHPLLQLLWLCWSLIAPWVSLAIDAYLWAFVSLFSLYASVPLMLLCAVKLFRVRADLPQRRSVRHTLYMNLGATAHLLLHLAWVSQVDWSF